MLYEGAHEVHYVSGWVLAEDFSNPGILVWHKIEANLVHPELVSPVDAHRVTCGEHIFGAPHPIHLGHYICQKCEKTC